MAVLENITGNYYKVTSVVNSGSGIKLSYLVYKDKQSRDLEKSLYNIFNNFKENILADIETLSSKIKSSDDLDYINLMTFLLNLYKKVYERFFTYTQVTAPALSEEEIMYLNKYGIDNSWIDYICPIIGEVTIIISNYNEPVQSISDGYSVLKSYMNNDIENV